LLELSDYYGDKKNFPRLCHKTLHLFNSTDTKEVDTHSYVDPTLTLTIPGVHTYHFSLNNYQDIISDTFEFWLDPCSVTHFLDDHYDDSDLYLDGLDVTLPDVSDYWGAHYLFNDPNLCNKKLYLNHSISGTDFTYKFSDPVL
jgi:hypothetical protein